MVVLRRGQGTLSPGASRSRDTHTLDTHTLDTHTLDTHALDTHTLDTHTLDTHTLDTHTLDTHTLDTHTREWSKSQSQRLLAKPEGEKRRSAAAPQRWAYPRST